MFIQLQRQHSHSFVQTVVAKNSKMSFNVINVQSLLIIFILYSHQTLADLSSGQCPQIQMPEAKDIKPGIRCNSMKLVQENLFQVQSYLPSSPDYKRMSPFSFDFSSSKMNNEKKNQLPKLMLHIYCTQDVDISILLNEDRPESAQYNFWYNGKEYEFLSLTEKQKLMPGCTQVMNQMPDYHYEIKFKKGEYLLVWGCVQVNASTYDRGLILASRKKGVNSSELFETMLDDTGLRSEVGISELSLFRVPPEKNEPKEKNHKERIFFSECLFSSGIQEETEKTIKIIASASVLITFLFLIIIVICVKFII